MRYYMINKNDSNSIKEVLYMSWSTLKNYNKLKMMLKNDNVSIRNII